MSASTRMLASRCLSDDSISDCEYGALPHCSCCNCSSFCRSPNNPFRTSQTAEDCPQSIQIVKDMKYHYRH